MPPSNKHAFHCITGRVSIGVCYSFFVYSFSFAFALSNVTATLGELSKAAGTMARTLWVLRKCEEEEEEEEYGSSSSSSSTHLSEKEIVNGDHSSIVRQKKKKKKKEGNKLENLRGEIELQNVCFTHPNGWQMKSISMKIAAGSTVALVGPSGGGKSTIAALLLGLYTPTSGQILIDGVPLQNLDMQWWRQQVGVVEQAPGLLLGPVADVVRYGKPEASAEEVQHALNDAQAAAFVAALPQQSATLLGAGGIELSGGQRQRLALARALLPKPTVLLLDEATSALDVGTETAVAEALASGRNSSATTVVIAHRLSTVQRADCIVVVADGRVVESGAPKELSQRRGGVYARMLRRSRGVSDTASVAASVDDEDDEDDAEGSSNGSSSGSEWSEVLSEFDLNEA